MADKYEVNTADLNLRREPDSSSSNNILAVLSKGERCEHLPSNLDNDKWIRIKVDSNDIVGFVAIRFLDKLPDEIVVPKKYIVKVTGSNVREEPNSSSGVNIVARLRAGDRCEHFPGDLDNTKWMRIRMDIDDTEMIGYIARSLLREETGLTTIPDEADELVAVHMPQNREHVDRDNKQGRAFPIGEPNRPFRNRESIATKAESLHQIVDWLDVEKSDRYAPNSSQTFCNIYAYDYVFLAGAYIPRVWWKSSAIADLVRGMTVKIIYGVSVKEMNVNSIHYWFEEYGGIFGWKRKFDVNEVQEDANNGKICVITAQQVNLNRSGHIVAIVPETDTLKADRYDNGKVKYPVQSQAGRTNRKYFTHVNNGKWWTRVDYRDFGFWVHD